MAEEGAGVEPETAKGTDGGVRVGDADTGRLRATTVRRASDGDDLGRVTEAQDRRGISCDSRPTRDQAWCMVTGAVGFEIPSGLLIPWGRRR